MSQEKPEFLKPIPDSELTEELRRKFHMLIEEVGDQFNNEFVSAHPILAHTVAEQMSRVSLLLVLCTKAMCKTDYPSFQKSIQFLIQQNPHALLWGHDGGFDHELPIHLIAKHKHFCLLLPWIAECYPWVLEHELCQKNPPHAELVRHHVISRVCDRYFIQNFYEIYPKGLQEKGVGGFSFAEFPLAKLLMGSEEPDADLFIWMAKRFPEAVHHELRHGLTALHLVCNSLAMDAIECSYFPDQCTPNMAKICRFLISEHPQLIRKQVFGTGSLPIHELAGFCNRPIVQEIVILLLKAYPECVQVEVGGSHPELSSVPFIQQVLRLIRQELDTDQELAQLVQVSQNVAQAAVLPVVNSSTLGSSLFGSVSEVVCSWADLRITVVFSASVQIKEHIAAICRAFEGDDPEDDELD